MARHSAAIAKFTGPRPVKGIVARNRLFERIDQSRSARAVWVAGLGGAGKTTLISSYLEDRNLPALWYHLDEGDSDIATFFHYMGLAAKAAVPDAGPLPLLTPEHANGLPTFTKRFFEHLFACLKKPAILVFDNYQEVPAESRFHDVLRESLPVVPGEVTVFILSRTEPPTELARAVARRAMEVIGWKELRFTLEETQALVRLLGRKTYTGGAIDQLHRKTDGWVAGLLLLLRQANQEEIDPAFLASHTPEEVFQYFATEIFNEAGPEIQDFLIATALLPQMTPQMAEALTGIRQAEGILSDMRRNQFFTNRRLGKEAVYEYHPLFREFLLARGRSYYPPGRLADLNGRAAALLEADGQVEAAMSLYHASGDVGNMVRLILDQAQTLLFQGRHLTLHQWLGRLPDELVSEEYWLLQWLANAKIRIDATDEADLFKRTLNASRKHEDTEEALLSLLGVIESITQEFDSCEAVGKLLPKLHAMCGSIAKFSSVDIEARVASVFLYLALRQPGHPDFRRWREKAVAILDGDEKIRPDAVIHLVSPIVLYEIFTGELAEAEILLEKYRGLIESKTAGAMTVIGFRNLEAYCFWQGGAFEKCFKAADDGLKTATEAGVHAFSTYLAGHAAASALIREDLSLAREYMKKMEIYSSHVRAWGPGYYRNVTTWLALIEEDHGKADMESHLGLEYQDKMEASHPLSLAHLGRALSYHLRGEIKDGHVHLEKAIGICKRVKNLHVEFSCCLAMAEFALDAGESTTALDALQEAMALGRKQGFLTSYYWRSKVMARLCEKALNAGIETDYVKTLIRKRNLSPGNPSRAVENWPWPIRIFTLGRFGIEIDGSPFPLAGKVRRTPLTLLKALVVFGGKDVAEVVLQDALWPDADGDAASNAFSTTLHRLRKMLRYEKAIRVFHGKISLDERICWVDVRMMERHLKEAENHGEKGRRVDPFSRLLKCFEKAIDPGPGVFLPDESASWAIPLRERLKARLLGCLERSVAFHAESGDFEKAIYRCNLGLEIDPCCEDFYQHLMNLYQKHGHPSQVHAAYRRCHENLAAVHGIEPSQKTKNILLRVQSS